jgi:hypothetical protein
LAIRAARDLGHDNTVPADEMADMLPHHTGRLWIRGARRSTRPTVRFLPTLAVGAYSTVETAVHMVVEWMRRRGTGVTLEGVP